MALKKLQACDRDVVNVKIKEKVVIQLDTAAYQLLKVMQGATSC